MRTVNAWAICDTDGGRREPWPLVKYVYETEQVAVQARQMLGLDPTYYPILPVWICG